MTLGESWGTFLMLTELAIFKCYTTPKSMELHLYQATKLEIGFHLTKLARQQHYTIITALSCNPWMEINPSVSFSISVYLCVSASIRRWDLFPLHSAVIPLHPGDCLFTCSLLHNAATLRLQDPHTSLIKARV